jgi:hypothetical protein
MADVWNPGDLATSGYIWFPIEFDGEVPRIPWQADWDDFALRLVLPSTEETAI